MRMQTGETLLHTGREDDGHMSGVVRKLSNLLATSEWSNLHSKVQPTICNIRATCIWCCDEEVKDVQNVIDKIPKHDKILLIWDLNTMVGDQQDRDEGVVDHHGLHGTGAKSHRYAFLTCKHPLRLQCVRIIITFSDCYNFNCAGLTYRRPT